MYEFERTPNNFLKFSSATLSTEVQYLLWTWVYIKIRSQIRICRKTKVDPHNACNISLPETNVEENLFYALYKFLSVFIYNAQEFTYKI